MENDYQLLNWKTQRIPSFYQLGLGYCSVSLLGWALALLQRLELTNNFRQFRVQTITTCILGLKQFSISTHHVPGNIERILRRGCQWYHDTKSTTEHVRCFLFFPRRKRSIVRQPRNFCLLTLFISFSRLLSIGEFLSRLENAQKEETPYSILSCAATIKVVPFIPYWIINSRIVCNAGIPVR